MVARLDDKGDPDEFSSTESLEEAQGIPWLIYEFDVSDTLLGVDPGSSIRVAVLDDQLAIADVVTPLNAGDDLILFLFPETAKTSPGIAPRVGDFFIPEPASEPRVPLALAVEELIETLELAGR